MPRTSERLIRNGYYDMYGQPLISYRDMPNRRRRITGRPVHGEVTFRERFHSLEDNMTVQENQTMDTLIRDCYNIFVFVFVIFVVFACICRIISLHSRSSELYVTPTLTDMVTISGGEDQEYLSRLQSLEAKLEYLLPQADLWPNFALGSQGATILHKMTSKTYQSIKGCRWFGKLPPIGPNIVIQGGTDLIPGQCWAFEGFPGRLSVELSNKVTVTHVSLGHIPKIVSPTASVSSAPREFSVYGKKNLEDEESHLGTFLYDEDGDRIQTFKVPANKVGSFRYVNLQVNSNWGHPDYTCLYSFRVHGELAE